MSTIVDTCCEEWLLWASKIQWQHKDGKNLTGPGELLKDGHWIPLRYCPACGADRVTATDTIDRLMTLNGLRRSEMLSEAETIMWDKWVETGFVESFMNAYSVGQTTNLSRVTTQFRLIVSWFERAASLTAHPAVFTNLRCEYGSPHIECFNSHGVVAIVVDGYLRALVPKSIVLQKQPKKRLSSDTGFHNKAGVIVAPSLGHWIRTKYGYVVSKGLFFQSLKEECVGVFGGATGQQRARVE